MSRKNPLTNDRRATDISESAARRGGPARGELSLADPRGDGDASRDSLARVLNLSDGVFSVAMTLLVLGLQVPNLPAHHSEAELAQALLALWPSYANYALSFLIVGTFWIGHHQILSYVRHVDRRFLWLNLLSLLAIGLIPFLTAILQRYGDERVAVDTYAGGLAVIALLQLVLWLDATHQHRLIDPELDSRVIASRTFYSALIVVIFASSIVVAFWRVDAAELSWALTWLVVGVLHPKPYRRRTKKDHADQPARVVSR